MPPSQSDASRKLLKACAICAIFMTIEFATGWVANSLALMTDATHLLSDLSSFMISLFAIWVSTLPGTSEKTFGYHRAEILGALMSVGMIWIITALLCYEAIGRFKEPPQVDGRLMFATAAIGTVANLFMTYILGVHSHGLGDDCGGHGGGGSDDGHARGPIASDAPPYGLKVHPSPPTGLTERLVQPSDSVIIEVSNKIVSKDQLGGFNNTFPHNEVSDHHPGNEENVRRNESESHNFFNLTDALALPKEAEGTHSLPQLASNDDLSPRKRASLSPVIKANFIQHEVPLTDLSVPMLNTVEPPARKCNHDRNHGHTHGIDTQNLNLRAAYIHALGDLIQNIGVMLAAAVIWMRPDLSIADPICTLVFSIFVVITTCQIIREATNVLMEGTPSSLDIDQLMEDLVGVPGVSSIHDLHVWSLSVGKPSLACHLMVGDEGTARRVLREATFIIQHRYQIQHTTIQIDFSLNKLSCETDAHTKCHGRKFLSSALT